MYFYYKTREKSGKPRTAAVGLPASCRSKSGLQDSNLLILSKCGSTTVHILFDRTKEITD
uniref:Uncharacterized protein n=1 Tax=Meloidogyne enterolobii TaxID=390850 RepID=A0A6V7WR41_MELEN|nr:unnamed protein product [Meloidogyne enterolobii]